MTAAAQISEPAPALTEQVRIACTIATGEARDPSANAISVRAAHRDLNCKGRGTEWFRMVLRDGSFRYFSDERMPAGRFLASERHVTLHGDVYAGEIVIEHDRGGPVSQVWLAVDPHPSPTTGKVVKLIKIEWSKQRDGIRCILPTGASVTVANPRSKS